MGVGLVRDGIIDAKQLEEALIYQQSAPKGKEEVLGKILVKLGFCSEIDIAKNLAKSSGSRYLSLEENTPASNVQGLLTPEIVQKYNAIPFMFEDEKLIIAMDNPFNIVALQDLKLITGREILVGILTNSEHEYILNQYINSSTTLKDIDQYKEEELEKNDVLESQEDNEKPVIQLANQIISLGVRSNASDIHVEAQEKRSRIRFRVDGVLHEFMKVPSTMHAPLISRLKVMGGMDIAQTRIPQDGRISIKVDERVIDIRVATLPSSFGEKVTLRLIDRSSKLITLPEIGFIDQNLKRFNIITDLPYGFILITGPTGSGKSTSLYATLSKLNVVEKNIITIEDPIEKKIEGLNQVQVNSRAGMTFASVLKSILRSDPDTIMIGEIRDHETAKIAVESALTGHLVLSTLHTNESSGAITRLDDMGIEPFLTASSLAGVVAQRLIRKLCDKCKEQYTISSEELLTIMSDFPIDEGVDKYTLYKAKGCIHCNNTGYKGRIGVFELLVVSENIRKLILKRASIVEIKNLAIEEGMVTLRLEGLLKIKSGITSLEEICRVIV
jgi:type IV pilus assembly protein PilB